MHLHLKTTFTRRANEPGKPLGASERKVPLIIFLFSKGKNVFGKSKILNVESRLKRK